MSKRPANGYIVKNRGEQAYAFVPDTDLRGKWVRTDVAVLLVDCPACGEKKGFPCRNDKGEVWASTHYDRRHAAKGIKTVASPAVIIDLNTLRESNHG
jgi:hypothetical protein